MTISWGAWEDAGGNGMRAGIQIESVSTPVNGSSTFTVTFSCWTQNRANYADGQTFDLTTTGGVSASLSDSSIGYTNNEVGTATKRGPNQTATYTYSTYGTSPGSLKLNGTVNGTYNGVTPNVSVTQAVPARPYAVPSAPTSPSASRISDTQIDLSWTNHSTASALYTNVKVYRSTNGGAYTLIATLGLTAAYSDTTVAANGKYEYKIQASNSAGTADSTATTAVYTTPGAPTIGTATKQANGDVVVTWTNNVGYGDTAYTVRIEESQNGGAFSEIASVSGGVATYTHTAPSTSVTHTYRVRVRSTTGSLNGAYSSNSNTVTLLATASAPTGLSPSGVAQDAAGNVTLSWTHVPTDGTPQSKRQVQVKVDGGAYSDVVNDSSSTSSYTVTGGTWSNGHTITWKVRTAGANGTLGAYSAESSFTTSAKPTATISTPSGGTYDLSSLTVEFAYFQAQSSAQATWTARLYDDADVLLETISGTTETAGTFAYSLADGGTYTVTVVVTSAAGLESTVDSETFTVAYLPPAAVTVEGAFDAVAGSVVLTLTGDAPVDGVTEAIATVDVQRQINGGEWVTTHTGIVLDPGALTATVSDTLPITVGTNTYRVVAHSALPSSATSATEDVVTDEVRWGYLSGGTAFGTVARFKATPSFGVSAGRAKQIYWFAGRSKPVQFAGDALTTTLSVSGTLSKGSGTPADFRALGLAAGVHCWRGPNAERLFGSLSKMDVSETRRREPTSVAFSLTEVDFTEGDQ